jgi:hypothetical protein
MLKRKRCYELPSIDLSAICLYLFDVDILAACLVSKFYHESFSKKWLRCKLNKREPNTVRVVKRKLCFDYVFERLGHLTLTHFGWIASSTLPPMLVSLSARTMNVNLDVQLSCLTKLDCQRCSPMNKLSKLPVLQDLTLAEGVIGLSNLSTRLTSLFASFTLLKDLHIHDLFENFDCLPDSLLDLYLDECQFDPAKIRHLCNLTFLSVSDLLLGFDMRSFTDMTGLRLTAKAISTLDGYLPPNLLHLVAANLQQLPLNLPPNLKSLMVGQCNVAANTLPPTLQHLACKSLNTETAFKLPDLKWISIDTEHSLKTVFKPQQTNSVKFHSCQSMVNIVSNVNLPMISSPSVVSNCLTVLRGVHVHQLHPMQHLPDTLVELDIYFNECESVVNDLPHAANLTFLHLYVCPGNSVSVTQFKRAPPSTWLCNLPKLGFILDHTPTWKDYERCGGNWDGVILPESLTEIQILVAQIIDVRLPWSVRSVTVRNALAQSFLNRSFQGARTTSNHTTIHYL